MYQIGNKLKYKGNWASFTIDKTYEIATQKLADKKFIIFDDNNEARAYDKRLLEENFIFAKEDIKIMIDDKALNNGGSTDYYKFKENWKECADIIEDREMNYNQGNIFKSAFCFNIGRHSGTDYIRELNKIIYFANRELESLKNANR